MWVEKTVVIMMRIADEGYGISRDVQWCFLKMSKIVSGFIQIFIFPKKLFHEHFFTFILLNSQMQDWWFQVPFLFFPSINILSSVVWLCFYCVFFSNGKNDPRMVSPSTKFYENDGNILYLHLKNVNTLRINYT